MVWLERSCAGPGFGGQPSLPWWRSLHADGGAGDRFSRSLTTRLYGGGSLPHMAATKPRLIRQTSWRILSGGTGRLRGRRGEADVGVGTLRDDLLSVPGVEQAEIDGDSVAPAGVRVRLSPGVDPAAAGD